MKSRKEFVSMFDTQGYKIKDLMDIQDDMKVFIVSTDDKCIGVTGLDGIDTDDYKTNENRVKSKNAFLKACEKWIDKNNVETTLHEKDFSLTPHKLSIYRKDEIN
jgi:hypothetical protein